MLILAGGSDTDYSDYWKGLSEVVLREQKNPSILSCMFSLDRADRPLRHEVFDVIFRSYFGTKCTIEYAGEGIFYEQISRADVIYLHGGVTEKLINAIPNVDGFKDAVKGKIVIGSSAGANFLSLAGFSPKRGEVISGSGLVSAGVVVHYGITSFKDTTYSHEFWRTAAQKVREQLGAEFPLLLLPEGQFVVLDDENH